MNTLAFLFPGVGSQYTGMGSDFYAHFPVFRQTIEEASDVLAIDMGPLCFDKDRSSSLNHLVNSQCALVAVSYGIYRVFMQKIGLEPACCMGHSLGEYSALCASGILSLADALLLVKKRGEIILETIEQLDGTMVWVINIDSGKVDKLCLDMRKAGKKVFVSAYDAPTQTSISGHKDAIKEAARALEKLGAIVYPLQLSGPFHSPLMKPAAIRMKKELERINSAAGKYPVVASHNTRFYDGPDSVPVYLSDQLVRPVCWRQSLEMLSRNDISFAVELGPKEVLSFLTAKNSDHIRCFPAGNENGMTRIRQDLVLPRSTYRSVIGRCLGLIASTPYAGHEDESYEASVAGPFNILKDLYLRVNDAQADITCDEMLNSISLLRTALNAKKVAASSQKRKIQILLDHKMLV
jgi:[acyl-carrier-protein] S-malonyltransferase